MSFGDSSSSRFQSINQHIYLNITATVAGFKKTKTHKLDIELIENNQIMANA